ncbi:MAG: enoyl-CoA hydratase/isomerase family protein [Desulfobacterales bacterium]
MMDPIHYTMDEHVAVLTMNNGENRFNFAFFNAYHQVLDAIEQNSEAGVLVVRSSHEKIWSNGIDLDWLRSAVEEGGESLAAGFYKEMYAFLKRVLTFPMITIAAITGHAFAGGAFLSFVHDFRFMRSDRGWLCLPEVDLGMRLGKGLIAISRRVLPMYLFEDMQFTGRRLTARECEEHRIIRKACHIDQLMKETMNYAKSLNKDRSVIRDMKWETHEALIGILDDLIAEFS